MKNIAIILAGGIGSRMCSTMPKQFLMLNDKPVIIHTLYNFEKNRNIDNILVVCEKNWIDYLKALIEKWRLSKVEWIIPGGGHRA